MPPNKTYHTDNVAPVWGTTLFKPSHIYETKKNWNRYFPYQLKILEAVRQDDGTTRYDSTNWEYTLPVSPQELTVDMPIATTVTPTLTGIVEQHGGTPFRTINIQSTTGITPIKNKGAGLSTGLEGVVNNVFGGTVQNVEGITASVSNMVSGNSFKKNINKGIGSSFKVDSDLIPDTSTGFYQYLLLERFLESYSNMKANGSKQQEMADGKVVDFNSLRLAFCIWKEQAVYLVSGVQLTRRRSANSPMEYNYNLQLKAWARVDLTSIGPRGYQFHLAARDPTIVADIFNRFRAARQVIDTAGNLMDSILKETGTVVKEALRQTGLALKGINNIEKKFEDYPQYIQNAILKSTIAQWDTLKNNFNEVLLNKEILIPHAYDWKTGYVEEDVAGIINKVNLPDLNLPDAILGQIQFENDLAASIGRLGYQEIKGTIASAADAFADAIGAGDVDYHTIYDTPIDNMKTRTPSAQEWDVMYALAETIQVLDYLAASNLINPVTITSVDYIAGLAEQSGQAFKKPLSKFAVPFPYGYTLEKLSLQYLKDANRWLEIAVLNGLREPYIDEVGFKTYLLVNGDRNQILVPTDSRFYKGQSVWLTDRYLREKRHIIDITKPNTTQYIITLDGEGDLQRFKTIDEAYVEAYLPGTVNSQQSIYIPSNAPPTEDPESRQIPGVDQFDTLLDVGGIDLLLTEKYDLAISPNGDCLLAYGLANIIQNVKIAISTPNGALLQHPQFGFVISAGTSLADLDVDEIAQSIKNTFTQDSMFTGVTTKQLRLTGNTLFIDLEIEVAGLSKSIPVTIQVQK